jgi:preprotein translocase subunit SecA
MLKTITKLQHLLDFHHTSVQIDLSSYQDLLTEINRLKLDTYSLNALRKYSSELKLHALNGVPLENILAKAYALVREVSSRLLGLRPFEVQVLAGIAMHHGKIVEMLTGEGKTLAAVMPAYLNVLTGQGVHILTFNDYLAKRDAQWMGSIYDFLELQVDYIQSTMNTTERKKAYACDITYVTAKEAGFDYLRSFLCYDQEELLQRPFHFAIVDEADSILIDEGRIPLVIAGNCPFQETELRPFAELVRELQLGTDYSFDENKRNVYLTEAGIARLEKKLGSRNLYTINNLTLLTQLNNALHAETLLLKDIDYIIRDGRVELVDEFTGRVVENRHWPDGLQESIEAKENLDHRSSGKLLGSITLQHFLNCYPKIAGMTGTARTAADEFKEFYNLEVVVIPPNRPYIRTDEPDLIFTHQAAKLAALIAEITKVHATGRPILIGTGNIQESEHLANLLAPTGILYKLLNAKNDELEAEIIAEAGSLGTVTIATNMAGRGTDIHLGGLNEQDREQVTALGGLYVIGANHFESTRIDDQLRGRAGRQGDPGSSRFFISLEDELITQYGIMELIPTKYKDLKQNEPIVDSLVAKQIIIAQKIIEAQNYEIRRNLWEYAWIVEQQRRIIHERRQSILLELETPHLFKTALPDRYQELAKDLGEAVLNKVEKYVTLSKIDLLWADFLDEIAQIREGIHLVCISGKNPLLEFHKMVTDAYQDLQLQIEQEIIETLKYVKITTNGIDLKQAGLRGPSATWTYLINDTPFGGKLQMQLAPLLKKLLKKGSESINDWD